VTRQTTVLVALPLAVLAGAASLAAAGSNDDTTIHACKQARTGLVRIVRPGASCRRNEMPISWNARGPRGNRGSRDRRVARGPQAHRDLPGPRASADLPGRPAW
jgi:hypothetical protein